MNIIFDLDDTLHDKSASLKSYADELLNTTLNNLEVPKQRFVSEFITQNNTIQPKPQVFSVLAECFNFSPQLKRNLLVAFDRSFHEFDQLWQISLVHT
ncbi:TPA: hypothetical protein NJ077_005100 [Vibrio parahaemolyticus]|uniref:hypothetical protein n=1 Tax=Vibrio parahaemolyticus TaxID=670 RepID=UPI0003ED9324|nr:hypothetical protein [Vibrio parahaemolyticus]AHI99027.1 hypothetical protein VPUCM_1069 [Vibrio parahaemolyticus UCM-V493]MBM4844254.1 hypothetical protein [Vibrio parahaemolyticus]HCG6120254.1 hypothetical protein [Vibrio parahaemolyticus]HCG6123554.1 hypothetical protein [Vibrio parahaemolyticus]